MPEPAPIFLSCGRCGEPLTLTGDDAATYRPGHRVEHAPGQCPREIARRDASADTRPLVYELDLVLRARPVDDSLEVHDDMVAASETLSRTTVRVTAISGLDALAKLLNQANDGWDRLVELTPIADAGYREELAAEDREEAEDRG